MKPDKLFMAGVLGDLDQQGSEAFETLVRLNPEKARRLAALRGLEAAMRSEAPSEPPAGLAAKVLDAVALQAAGFAPNAGTQFWRRRWALICALMGLAFGAIAMGMAMVTYGEPEVVRQTPWIGAQFRLVLGAAVVFSGLALFMHKGGVLGRWGAGITAMGYAVALAFNAYMIWTSYGPGPARAVLLLFLALVLMAGTVIVLGFLRCDSDAARRMGFTSTADTK